MKPTRCKFCGATNTLSANIEECLCCTAQIEKVKNGDYIGGYSEQDKVNLIALLFKAHEYNLRKTNVLSWLLVSIGLLIGTLSLQLMCG